VAVAFEDSESADVAEMPRVSCIRFGSTESDLKNALLETAIVAREISTRDEGSEIGGDEVVREEVLSTAFKAKARMRDCAGNDDATFEKLDALCNVLSSSRARDTFLRVNGRRLQELRIASETAPLLDRKGRIIVYDDTMLWKEEIKERLRKKFAYMSLSGFVRNTMALRRKASLALSDTVKSVGMSSGFCVDTEVPFAVNDRRPLVISNVRIFDEEGYVHVVESLNDFNVGSLGSNDSYRVDDRHLDDPVVTWWRERTGETRYSHFSYLAKLACNVVSAHLNFCRGSLRSENVTSLFCYVRSKYSDCLVIFMPGGLRDYFYRCAIDEYVRLGGFCACRGCRDLVLGEFVAKPANGRGRYGECLYEKCNLKDVLQ